jgi:hypothetical protein
MTERVFTLFHTLKLTPEAYTHRLLNNINRPGTAALHVTQKTNYFLTKKQNGNYNVGHPLK